MFSIELQSRKGGSGIWLCSYILLTKQSHVSEDVLNPESG